MDGELVPFKGRADRVIEDASKVFMNSTQSSYLTPEEREAFITKNISVPTVSAMMKNVVGVSNRPFVEENANTKAAEKLGRGNSNYNLGITPIIFNGKKLK